VDRYQATSDIISADRTLNIYLSVSLANVWIDACPFQMRPRALPLLAIGSMSY
ncbi:uncharacterized protein METZ01_LOCUS185927, partial [marine metagenome]